jgi:AraC-like DNA-binding protein
MSGVSVAVAATSPFARRADLPYLEACAGTHIAGVTTHVTDRWLLGAVHSGGIELQVGRSRLAVPAGAAVVVPVGSATRSRHVGPTRVSVLFIEPDEVSRWQEDHGEGPALSVVQAPQAVQRISALAAALRRPELTATAIEETLLSLLPALPRAGAAVESRCSEPHAVRRARELLHARYKGGVSLDELASETGLNKHYLHKAFRSQIGMGPHAYVVQLRVAAARRLIAAGVSLRQACQQSGFYDQSHLSRAFSETLGITPGAYAAATTWQPWGASAGRPGSGAVPERSS